MKFILTADWHLRDDQPKCRLSPFMETQEKAVRCILETAEQKNAIIVHAGDFFHKPKPSPFLLQWIIELLKQYNATTFVYPGNHDLPYRKKEHFNQSGLAVLQSAGVVERIFSNNLESSYNIYIDHVFVDRQNEGNLPNNLCKAWDDREIDLILVGDNHESHEWERKAKIGNETRLINPGCITRQNLSEMEYNCGFFLFDTANRTFLWHYTDQKEDFNPEYVQMNADNRIKNEQMEAFINSLSEEYKLGLSFEENIKHFFKQNKIEEEVKKRVQEMIDEN